MFENQTEEEEEEVIFERDNRGYWCTLQEGKRAFSDNQSQLQELQTIQVVFLYALQWCKFC